MTDSVNTDALREIAVREDRESDTFIDGDIADERYWELREVADALITAADEIDALRARCVEHVHASLYDSMRDALRDELAEARARAERAEAVIAAAPHATECPTGEVRVPGGWVHVDGKCTCWKADYARASQPASEVEQ